MIVNPLIQTSSGSRRRIYFMDEVRGFDLILMVFFHAFFVIGYLFDFAWGRELFLFFNPAEPFFAGLFIFICGISCRLSHSNWKRGGLLLLVAAGKAAWQMTHAAVEALSRVDGGVVVTKYGHMKGEIPGVKKASW